jgi:hypothetical protein
MVLLVVVSVVVPKSVITQVLRWAAYKTEGRLAISGGHTVLGFEIPMDFPVTMNEIDTPDNVD